MRGAALKTITVDFTAKPGRGPGRRPATPRRPKGIIKSYKGVEVPGVVAKPPQTLPLTQRNQRLQDRRRQQKERQLERRIATLTRRMERMAKSLEKQGKLLEELMRSRRGSVEYKWRRASPTPPRSGSSRDSSRFKEDLLKRRAAEERKSAKALAGIKDALALVQEENAVTTAKKAQLERMIKLNAQDPETLRILKKDRKPLEVRLKEIKGAATKLQIRLSEARKNRAETLRRYEEALADLLKEAKELKKRQAGRKASEKGSYDLEELEEKAEVIEEELEEFEEEVEEEIDG